MNYSIILSDNALKSLKKIPEPFKTKIKQYIDNILEKKYIKVKNTNLFRVRVGDYRIIYIINNEKIYIEYIGHRKNIYDKVNKSRE